MPSKAWLIYALVTVAFWGVWGVFAGLPASHGFSRHAYLLRLGRHDDLRRPPYALQKDGWRIPFDGRSMLYGGPSSAFWARAARCCRSTP